MPRNASGIYTLPAGNPVVPGDIIDAAWANSTLSDMATEITNSLSRTGAGGMIAPFRVVDGTVAVPGVAFLNETNTGPYRPSAGTYAMSILGVNTATFSTVGLTIPASKALTAQGNASVGGTLAVTGAATYASTLAVTGAIVATGGVVGNVAGNVTAVAGSSSFNDVVITGSLDMTAGSSATITGLSTPTNASDAANKGYVDTQDALRLALTGGTMSGAIAMGSNAITGLAAPSASGDATNKSYVDTQVATRLPLAGGTMSGAIAMGTSKITGLGTPTADADAATKAYVDSVAQGLDVKGSVRAATTANITLSGTQTIDGVAVIAGDRVLVKDQSTAANNGIYVAAAGAWSRSADADTWAELVGAFVFVEDGTVNDNSGWVCTSPPGGTLGVTAVTFEQFSGAGQINAGTGMTKTGNTLNVNTASSSRIVVGADEIDLATTGVTAGTYKSVTVDLYGRVTAGTNPTSLAGYGITDAYTQTQTDNLLNAKLSLAGGTMTGNLAMGGFKVTGLGAPANADDAATKTYVDTGAALKLNLTGGTMSGAIAMGTNKITGMGDPTNPQDAATKSYIDTIFGSTASAAASASAAATSATNASNSASAAATSATNSASSATASSTSASASAASAASSLSYLNQFRGQYYGSAASNPTVDPLGNPPNAGDLYFNTTANEMRVYTGSAWVAAGSTVNGTAKRQTFTATQGQTTFTVTGGYDAGFADVYLNGVKQVNGTDVTVSSGTNVVLAIGAAAGDTVDVVAYGSFSLANMVAKTGDVMTGNLGIKGTPSGSWDSSYAVLQMNTTGALNGNAVAIAMSNNNYFDGTNIRYLTTAPATDYFQYNGVHTWRYAASGTGGAVATMNVGMVMDASGNVGMGTPSPGYKLDLNGASGVGMQIFENSTGNNNRLIISQVAGITTYNSTYSSGSTNAHSWQVGNTQQMRLDAAGVFQFNSGYGSVATAYGCRAWVNFNGTGTVAIRASANVTSITDNGTGDYTVNFTNAMPDANYAATTMALANDTAGTQGQCAVRGDSAGGATTMTTTALRINTGSTSSNVFIDRALVTIAIFR